jgi:HK97 family phage major capsid protein
MSRQLLTLKAELELKEGSLTARLVPYGSEISHMGRKVSFSQGQIGLGADVVPVNLDHGKGALERIGKATELADQADGLYATLALSDTAAGRDALTLLRDGVLTDVSAGIWLADDGGDQLSGELDHVAIVQRGAFGNAGAGSKVLAVHSSEEETMKQDTAPTEELTGDEGVKAAMATFTEEAEKLRKVVAELQVPGAVKARPEGAFDDKRDFILTLAKASRGDSEAMARMEQFALADDTTTTAVGVVPDYLSSRVIELVDTRRPYLNTIRKDPIGDHGMSVVYPEVISGPTVAVQASEKTEVESTAMNIDPRSVDLLTYAGASDVSRQLVERSQPSFVDILFRHYAKAYAKTTDGAAADAAAAGAASSSILADLGADAAATFAAVNAGNAAIIAAVDVPATHWLLGPTRWTQLNSLTDADGRPLLVYGPNGPTNAQGQSDFTAMVAQYHGLTAYLDPNAGANVALMYNAEEYAFYLESGTVQLRAEVVSLLGFDMGVYGLFAHEVEHAGAGHQFTIA